LEDGNGYASAGRGAIGHCAGASSRVLWERDGTHTGSHS
jgi:hypothetical protein